MAKGLTRCNVCGRTAEQVFEGQMLISIHERMKYQEWHRFSTDICHKSESNSNICY